MIVTAYQCDLCESRIEADGFPGRNGSTVNGYALVNKPLTAPHGYDLAANPGQSRIHICKTCMRNLKELIPRIVPAIE